MASATLSPGAALVKQEDCLACHMLGDAGAAKGPPMEWIGARRDAQWIASYVANPQAFAPEAAMPAYDHLTPEQRQLIGEFVVSLAASHGR
ncbi:MAG: c-type cytochrome [Thermoanaerobaculaceae bacterium]